MRPLASLLFALGFGALACSGGDALGRADDDPPNENNGNAATDEGAEKPSAPTPPQPTSDPSGSTGQQPGEPGETKKVRLAITLLAAGKGSGTVTSIPAGLTCTGGKCEGFFTPGTVVTLAAVPAAGSIFTGCPGQTSCTFTMAEKDIDATAEFDGLKGTTSWYGTFTHKTTFMGCTFGNKGDLSIVMLSSDDEIGGYLTGLELRTSPGCNLAGTTVGNLQATSTFTATGTSALSGKLLVKPNQGSTSTIDLPFSAAVQQTPKGTTMFGNWTCPGCTGSFTLVRPANQAKPMP